MTGTTVAHYRILEKLGGGGMGVVYKAEDTTLGRDVALKVLPEAFAKDAERMARFQREAKVLASLNHPNIAAIYGLEESSGTRALVMELVEGPTLADKIRVAQGSPSSPAAFRVEKAGEEPQRQRAGTALQIDECLHIAKQIAEALEYAHERGIVHRDLKPANIKNTPEGAVKILDFGLAKALNPQDSAARLNPSNSPTLSIAATQAGVILGTAAYMSPEQAKGKPVDRRADIWAFGCVLFEMLSAQKAFEGETASDTLAAVLRAEPDWSTLPETTPPAIQTVIRRCLEKDPRQRLQAIGEARIAIEETMSGADVATGFGPARKDAAPSLRSGQALKGGATAGERSSPLRRALPRALAGLLAVALTAVVLVWKVSPPGPLSAMHFSAVTNFAGVQAQPAISPDGRSVAFVSNRDGHFNIYVGLVHGGNLVQITHDPSLESAPSWSPDGSTLAYARLSQWGIWDIWEVPALGGTPRRVILNAADPAWSPDGHSLAYLNMADGAIWISGTSGENARQAAPPGPVWSLDTEPRFSPDGRRIAFAARSATGAPYGELAVADLTSGKTRLLTHDDALALSPAWSPDGRFIYFASSGGGTINIWKIAANGGEPEQITAGEGDDADFDVSADGKRIVFGTLRQKIGIAQLDFQAKPGQANVKVLTTDPGRNAGDAAYSPDGKHLAYFTNLKGAEHEAIWVSDADGSNAAPLVQDSRSNIFPAWSPDGKDLLYYSQRKVEWAGEYRSVQVSGGSPQTLLGVPDFGEPDVGRDGRLLFPGPKGQAEAFDPRDGKTQTLGALPAGVWLLRWSPDEHSAAYMVQPRKQDDANAGLWVDDFKNPPRQVFQGWVVGYARGPGNELYLLEGKPDLNSVLWKVDWNGQGLTRTSWTVPILYNFNYYHTLTANQFDVSPDGRYLAFQTEQVLEENIGMIENVR